MTDEYVTVTLNLFYRHPREFDAHLLAQDLYSGLTAEEFINLYKRMGELLCGFVNSVGGSTDG